MSCVGLNEAHTNSTKVTVSNLNLALPRAGLDPEMLLAGGALKAEGLNRASKAARGDSMRWGGGEYERGVDPPPPLHSSGGEVGGPPPEIFLKSLYLRTHVKPF